MNQFYTNQTCLTAFLFILPQESAVIFHNCIGGSYFIFANVNSDYIV